jgi:hypothetical protein
MKLIVGRVIAARLHIMHVQKETHCAGWGVGPRDFWRCLITRRCVFRWNLGAIGESSDSHN